MGRKEEKVEGSEGGGEKETMMENLAMKRKKWVCQAIKTKMPPESFSFHAYLTDHAATVPAQDQREGVRPREPCALQTAAVLQSAK